MLYQMLRGHGYAQLGFIVKAEYVDKRTPPIAQNQKPKLVEHLRTMNPESAWGKMLDMMTLDIRNGNTVQSAIILNDELGRVFKADRAMDYCDERAYMGRYYSWQGLILVTQNPDSPVWNTISTSLPQTYANHEAFMLDLLSHNSYLPGYGISYSQSSPGKIDVWKNDGITLFHGAYSAKDECLNLYPSRLA